MRWYSKNPDDLKFSSSDYTILGKSLSTITKAINGYFWVPVGTGEVLEDSIKVSDSLT